jgi:hypothetical protein
MLSALRTLKQIRHNTNITVKGISDTLTKLGFNIKILYVMPFAQNALENIEARFQYVKKVNR